MAHVGAHRAPFCRKTPRPCRPEPSAIHPRDFSQHPSRGFARNDTVLLDEFADAVRALNLLNTRQTRAVIAGDRDFTRFDILICLAQERKETAKYTWIAHVESHRCEEVLIYAPYASRKRTNFRQPNEIQSVTRSLSHLDPSKIEDFEAIQECLEDAEKNLTGALEASDSADRPKRG